MSSASSSSPSGSASPPSSGGVSAASAASPPAISAERAAWLQAGRITDRNRIDPMPPRAASRPLCHPSDPVQIHFLADHPEWIAPVAKACWGEWRDIYVDYYDIRTEDEAVVEIGRENTHRDQLNSTYVAVIDGQLAACAMLCTEDTPATFAYYGVKPWIACLFVFEAYRGRGLVQSMIDALSTRCADWGYTHVWLITQHLQKTYQRLGFKTIETLEVYDHAYTVMRRDFERGGKPIKTLTEQDAKEAHREIHPERY